MSVADKLTLGIFFFSLGFLLGGAIWSLCATTRRRKDR